MRRERNQYIFASELTRRNRSHRFRTAVLLFLPIMIAVLWMMNITISRRVQVQELRLTVLNLPNDLEGFSILHLSDLHGERFGEGQKVVDAALDKTRFSCVVMTGDMLGEDGDVQPLLELVDCLPRDVPKFLIPGDTDGPAAAFQAHRSLSGLFLSYGLFLSRPLSQRRWPPAASPAHRHIPPPRCGAGGRRSSPSPHCA